jgi:hypothetical protein
LSDHLLVTNLLLAAFLESGGASISRITPKGRYSQVTIDMTHFNKEALTDKVARLGRVIDRIEDVQELKHLFSASMLGEVEDRYIRLKRRVVNERNT